MAIRQETSTKRGGAWNFCFFKDVLSCHFSVSVSFPSSFFLLLRRHTLWLHRVLQSHKPSSANQKLSSNLLAHVIAVRLHNHRTPFLPSLHTDRN